MEILGRAHFMSLEELFYLGAGIVGIERLTVHVFGGLFDVASVAGFLDLGGGRLHGCLRFFNI